MGRLEKKMNAEEILKMAETAARRYRRKCWWASVDDMMQEAATAMVKSQKDWDPKVGVPLEAYLWTVAVRSIKPMLLRDSAPVSASSKQREHLKRLTRAPLDDKAPDMRPTTEDSLRSAQWQEEVWSQVLTLDPSRGLAAQVLVREKRSAEVARDNGVPVRQVYSATSKTRSRLRESYDLYRLWKEGA